MYAPKFFRERSLDRMIALVETNPFGLITTVQGGQIEATHLPMLIERMSVRDGTRLRLLSHFARSNRQGRALSEGDEVLCIFQGPHGYITPEWYRDEEDVPTYNYSAVHIRGRYGVIQEPGQVRNILEKTTHFFESDKADPWSMDDIDRQLVESLTQGVRCFAVDVTAIEGASKHSQDKTEDDRAAVLDGLEHRGRKDDLALCAQMRRSLCPGG